MGEKRGTVGGGFKEKNCGNEPKKSLPDNKGGNYPKNLRRLKKTGGTAQKAKTAKSGGKVDYSRIGGEGSKRVTGGGKTERYYPGKKEPYYWGGE